MAGTPKTIERTALLVSKPTGKADNARSSAHGLEPAADAPKNGKKNKGMHKTEEKIYQCSHKQPGGHETVDITPVGQKTVCELAYSVGKEKHRTDNAQFGFRKDTFLYNRLLHHIQAQTADIIHPISQGCGKEGGPLQPFQTPLLHGQRLPATRLRLGNLVKTYQMFQHNTF